MKKFLFLLLLPLVVFSACNLSSSMLVTPGVKTVSYKGESFKLNLVLTSKDPTWTAEVSDHCEWLTLARYSGRGDAIFYAYVEANPDTAARSAIIKFTDTESIAQVIISQEGCPKSEYKGGNNGGSNNGGTNNGGENNGGTNNGGENNGGENGGNVQPTDPSIGEHTAVFLDKYVFAPGNLQYCPKTDTWRFASKQTYCIEDGNQGISATYSGYIDLFGWGTSGYNNRFPYMISIDNSAYGPMVDEDLLGTYANYDWGVYNSSKITNSPDKSYKWHLLESYEWQNILEHYPNTLATVNDVKGLLIFSKAEEATGYALTFDNYTSVVIESTAWLDEHAVVFLPAAGIRESTTFSRSGVGKYHTASSERTTGCGMMVFAQKDDPEDGDSDGAYTIGEPQGRHIGASVRLVRNIK